MKPRIFFASSSRALEDLRLLATYVCDGDWAIQSLWNRDAFPPGETYLAALRQQADECDLAVFLWNDDDTLTSEGVTYLCPRDNVIFEFGLMLSRKDPRHVAVVAPTTTPKLRRLSDYDGYKLMEFSRTTGTRDEYLCQPASEVRQWLRRAQPAAPAVAVAPATDASPATGERAARIPIYRDMGENGDWFRKLRAALSLPRPHLNSNMVYYGPGLHENWIKLDATAPYRNLHEQFAQHLPALLASLPLQPLSVVDLGVGDFEKSKKVLSHLLTTRSHRLDYFPLDVSYEMLSAVATKPEIGDICDRGGRVELLHTTFDRLLNHQDRFRSADGGTLFLLLGNTLGNELNDSDTLSTIAAAMSPDDVLLVELQLLEDAPSSAEELAEKHRASSYFYFGPFHALGCNPNAMKLEVTPSAEDDEFATSYNFVARFTRRVTFENPGLTGQLSIAANKPIGVYIVRKYKGEEAVTTLFAQAGLGATVRATQPTHPEEHRFCYVLAKKLDTRAAALAPVVPAAARDGDSA